MSPSPPHLTQLTAAVWLAMEKQACRVMASHTRVVPSLDPLTSRRLGSAMCAGSQAIEVIHLVCPCPFQSAVARYCIICPCSAIARCGVRPSVSPVMMQWESTLQPLLVQSQYKGSKWGFARQGLAALTGTLTLQQPMGLPVAGSHSQSCPSMPPLARYFPSGENARHSTQFLWLCVHHAVPTSGAVLLRMAQVA